MKILGISAYYHDSAACLVEDGVVKVAAQEERFSRKKHDASFPSQAIQFCLDSTHSTLDELTAVAYYEKPFLKFERLIESYFSSAPLSLPSFLKSMPIWLKEKLNLRNTLYKNLKLIEDFDKSDLAILFPEHHLSHAASSFYTSPFREAAVLTLDGVGEWDCGMMGIAKEKEFEILTEMQFPHSIGLLYSAFTYYLGFKVNNGEYKVMGLAPYGDRSSPEFKSFKNIIETQLIDIKPDGSLWLNQFYFDYLGGLKMIKEDRWTSLFGMPARKAHLPIEKKHCHLALALQTITEEVILAQANTLRQLSEQENLCLAGGVALNSVANGKLLGANMFNKIHIMPAAGDAGGAVGAALAVYHLYYQLDRSGPYQKFNPFLGPSYGSAQCLEHIRSFDCRYEAFARQNDLIDETAQLLKEGNVIGWFQGSMEFGPRALGNRCILADPTWPGMQDKINHSIKKRESFRPFAPAILKEQVKDYFDIQSDSPYMLYVRPLLEKWREELPKDYDLQDWQSMLSTHRSRFQAITHVDFSARIQTVDYFQNPLFYNLIKKFYDKTGIPMVLNTSFNLKGEPIVCSPLDALRCFFNSDMDILVMNKYIVKKNI